MTTKTLLGSVLLASVLMTGTLCADNNVTVTYVQDDAIQAKGLKQTKGLIDAIKPSLMESFKKDKTGVEGTVMCSDAAQEMTATYNKTLPEGSLIRRTAIKYRNPANKPDATDLVVMEDIVADGNFSKAWVVDMNDTFRVYKSLPMHKPCLVCHGDKDKMPQKMKDMISKKYPNDLATGLKEHEFRGVIVSEIKKEK